MYSRGVENSSHQAREIEPDDVADALDGHVGRDALDGHVGRRVGGQMAESRAYWPWRGKIVVTGLPQACLVAPSRARKAPQAE
jgi:hypothetical protein